MRICVPQCCQVTLERERGGSEVQLLVMDTSRNKGRFMLGLSRVDREVTVHATAVGDYASSWHCFQAPASAVPALPHSCSALVKRAVYGKWHLIASAQFNMALQAALTFTAVALR